MQWTNTKVHPTGALVLDDLLDGLKVAQLVRHVEALKDERERRVPAAHPLDGRLEPEEAGMAQQAGTGPASPSATECDRRPPRARPYQRS